MGGFFFTVISYNYIIFLCDDEQSIRSGCRSLVNSDHYDDGDNGDVSYNEWFFFSP